MMVLTMPYLQF